MFDQAGEVVGMNPDHPGDSPLNYGHIQDEGSLSTISSVWERVDSYSLLPSQRAMRDRRAPVDQLRVISELWVSS